MKPLAPAALLALLAACGGAPANNAVPAAPEHSANSAQAGQPASELPPGTSVNPRLWLPAAGAHQARAMVIAAPAEMQALADRIQVAMRANPDWFRAYAAEHPTGELPYHPNLGISEADYRRFLDLTHELSLNEVSRTTLTVTARPDGGLALAATGQAAPLNGVIVYPDRDRIETPHGALTHRSTIDNREQRSPTGPWQGVQWSNVGSARGRPVKLAFGRRAQGDLILYYDFGPSDAETIILLYQPPAAAATPAR